MPPVATNTCSLRHDLPINGGVQVTTLSSRRCLLQRLSFVLAATPSFGAYAKDPPNKDLKESDLPIGDPAPGGGLSNLQRLHVWEMNLEEDDKVRFYFRLTNTGPRSVRLVHCQPWAADSWARKEVLGPFGNVNAFDFTK